MGSRNWYIAKKDANKGIKIILTSPTPEFKITSNVNKNQQWFNRQ